MMASMNRNKMYKIILLIGQSNALGQSTNKTNLTGDYADFANELSDVRFANQLVCNNDDGAAACAFEFPARRVKDLPNSQGNFGPELGIARAIPNIKSHAATGNVIIVKCASGSTDLANDWAPGAVTGFVLYSRMLAFLQHSAQIWAGSYEVVGAIWVQGERDSTDLAKANAYEANLNAFIAQLRTDVGNATMPFIISRLHTDNVATYAGTIRTAQDAVAAADSNVTVVTPTPSLSGDAKHYDDNGYCELGETDLGPALDAYYTLCS